MGTNTNKMQGVGPSHETLKRSAGLPPARLVRNGDRVFTRSKVTASIGLKPLRLVVHHTRQKSIPISQFHSNTSCPDGDFSSTAYSRRLQLHSIQHTAIVVLQTSSAPQHTATTDGQQKTPAPQHTADSRLWQHTAIMAVQQTTVAPQHTATTTI